MKKPIQLLGLFFLSFFFLTALSADAQAQTAVVTNVQGNGKIIRGAQTMPASAGMAYQKDDILMTESNCVLDIAMNNLAGCRLLPSSECAVMDTQASSMHLKINNGNAILNLKKLPPASRFQLETPTAVAGVRGTQFWGRVVLKQIENPVTTFAVREGAVEVYAKSVGQSFDLRQGEALDIPKDPTVLPVIRPALTEELAAMEQASSIQTSA